MRFCQTLGREVSFEPELERLRQRLEEAYRPTISQRPVQIEQVNGEDVPNLERLERQEEPESLRLLRESIGACLPPVDLPELILEVAHHTGLFSQFTHVSDSNAHVEDLPLSIYVPCCSQRRAILVSHASFTLRFRHSRVIDYPGYDTICTELGWRICDIAGWDTLCGPGTISERRTQPMLFWTRPKGHVSQLYLRAI